MSSQLKQIHFQSPEEAIALAVDKQGKPTPKLLGLLELHKIKHDGSLKNIVENTQKAFHVMHRSGRTKKRWEINLSEEDAKYRQSLREQTISTLNEFGLFSEFVPTHKQFDYVFCHGSTLQDSLLRQAALFKQWQQGLRFTKLIVLSGPRLLEPSESIDKTSANLFYDTQKILLEKNNIADYKCEIDMVQYLWETVPLPAGMEKINYLWINSPDRIDSNGLPIWANTRDSLETWFEANKPIAPGSCLGISNAPFTLRQHIITETFLRKHGFADCVVETVSGPLSAPPSITICMREFSNVLWDYYHHFLL